MGPHSKCSSRIAKVCLFPYSIREIAYIYFFISDAIFLQSKHLTEHRCFSHILAKPRWLFMYAQQLSTYTHATNQSLNLKQYANSYRTRIERFVIWFKWVKRYFFIGAKVACISLPLIDFPPLFAFWEFFWMLFFRKLSAHAVLKMSERERNCRFIRAQ